MSKPGRKSAIAAELARRESALAVPHHLQVYALDPRTDHAGGSLTFYPSRQPTDRERAAHPHRLHSDFLRDQLRAAIDHGHPVDVAPVVPARVAAGRPFADFSDAFFVNLFILSRRAFDALAPLIAPHGRVVPVACTGHDLVGFAPEKVEDVLDTANTVASWIDPKRRERASTIYTYAFHTDRLAHAAPLLRVPQDTRQLFLQPIVDVACEHALTGFHFLKIWPHAGGTPWWLASHQRISPGADAAPPGRSPKSRPPAAKPRRDSSRGSATSLLLASDLPEPSSDDATALRQLIERTVATFTKRHAIPAFARRHPGVSRIDLTFSLDDADGATPSITLHLDTRPGADPDGTWAFPNFATLQRPAWSNAHEDHIGRFLIETLKSARAAGLFTPLPRRTLCELGVESNDGAFAWPIHKDRGKENLV